jgi:hypothetical protein
MVTTDNPPVLIGAVPLFTVTSLSLIEGYQVARIAGSTLVQLVSPTTRSITIEATIVGPDRLLVKKALEAMALTSRALAAATAPLMRLAGVPVVSGLTISLDMQITSLRFTQSNQKRQAIDVSIGLEHVPRSNVAVIAGEALELARGSAGVPSPGQTTSVVRQLGAPL